jgi:hypothetical protein
VDDTPISNAPNFGKPGYKHISLCNNNPVEMTMNIMDNTDDDSRYLFTRGQVWRMQAFLSEGGFRNAMTKTEIECKERYFVAANDRKIGALLPPETKDLTLKVYPNPSNDGFYLSINSKCTNVASIEILDASGKKAWSEQQTLALGQARIYVNSGNWSSGMYVIRVSCGDESAIARVLVEH